MSENQYQCGTCGRMATGSCASSMGIDANGKTTRHGICDYIPSQETQRQAELTELRAENERLRATVERLRAIVQMSADGLDRCHTIYPQSQAHKELRKAAEASQETERDGG